LIADNEESLRETAKLIDRIQSGLRPLHERTIKSRRFLDDSLAMLREIGMPWRASG
jgi:hypothetical protein